MTKPTLITAAVLALAIALPSSTAMAVDTAATEISAQKKRKSTRAAPRSPQQNPGTQSTGQSGVATGGEFSFGSAPIAGQRQQQR